MNYNKMVWTEQPPYLFGRFSIYGQLDPDGEDVFAALTVKPRGAGSRVEWEVCPEELDEQTIASGGVRIDDECDQDMAIAVAQEAAIKALNAFTPFIPPLRCPWRCHEIGGPWIAENPDCPFHGTNPVDRRKLEPDEGERMCQEELARREEEDRRWRELQEKAE